MVTIPKAEYDRLRALAQEADEDKGTARLVARAKREALAEAQIFPKQIADRLADGENPIRVLREYRDETQQELALAVGIAQGYLSDLEAGKRKGPLALHTKIARKLGVPLDLLATIAVSEKESDPKRYARRKYVVRNISRQRKYSN
jgi:DNA-binding XRE family transcriptional regulator